MSLGKKIGTPKYNKIKESGIIVSFLQLGNNSCLFSSQGEGTLTSPYAETNAASLIGWNCWILSSCIKAVESL